MLQQSDEKTKTITLPLHIKAPLAEDDMPLGIYGCELMMSLQRDYPCRYWELSLDGILISSVRARELEIIEYKLLLLDEIEKKFPRPKTNDFLITAAHMNTISDLVDIIIAEEVKKPF